MADKGKPWLPSVSVLVPEEGSVPRRGRVVCSSSPPHLLSAAAAEISHLSSISCPGKSHQHLFSFTHMAFVREANVIRSTALEADRQRDRQRERER